MRSFIIFLVFFFLAACGLDPYYLTDTANQDAEQGGGSSVQLPFSRSEERLCVQGYRGSYSHTGTSTMYDLDFDTSNYEQEELYAPEAGIARVHTESATANFGYHVNLDLGDGTYLVLAHFSKIFVADGDEVAPGTLLGYEGCTGLCTGDHLHYGRHEGDAALQAQYGTSIDTYIRAADTTAEEEFENASPRSFVCDEASGHWYASDLSVSLWHPDGTLLKVPSSSEVYLVEDGALRWIRNEDIFWSHGYNFDNLTLVSNEELDCYGEGEEIASNGLIDAYTDEFGFRWLVVGTSDDPDRYRQMVENTAWEGVMTSWGLTYSETNPPPDSSTYPSWPEVSGHVRFRNGTIVKEDSRSDVYVVTGGVAAPVVDWNTYLLAGFYQRYVIPVPDGAVAEVQEEVGDCSVGLWCLSSENLTTCGGGFDLSGAGDYGGDNQNGDNEESNDYGDTDEEVPCEDSDNDGHCSEYSGGDDCWDYNPYVYPGAEETCGNGIDEDCSGSDEPCPEGGEDSDSGDTVETDVDTDADSDTDSDSDSDTDTDSDSDSDTDTDSGYGVMIVTWGTDLGYNSQGLTAIYEYAPSEDDFESWASTTFAVADRDEITFSFMVPEGQTVRYSVEAYSYGSYDWSCESISYDEVDDELKGTHTVTYITSSGLTCDLSPSMYHKTVGTADGCEAMVPAECD